MDSQSAISTFLGGSHLERAGAHSQQVDSLRSHGMACHAESPTPQAGIDDIVGGIRGMMAQKQKQVDDALTPAELLERCAPVCDKKRRGNIFAAAFISALCLTMCMQAPKFEHEHVRHQFTFLLLWFVL